jgi:hypothetical protein
LHPQGVGTAVLIIDGDISTECKMQVPIRTATANTDSNKDALNMLDLLTRIVIARTTPSRVKNAVAHPAIDMPIRMVAYLHL